MQFTRRSLEAAGFVGWVPFANLPSSSCPTTGGVYVVAYSGGKPTAFLERSGAGWHKGKDPSVSNEQLTANWVDDAEIVYIGKGDDLFRRLIQFARFGAGKRSGHSGGRLIWQLPLASELRVAWKETPGRIPEEVEGDLIEQFRTIYGKPPFANSPDRWGK
jgi:hypothetical protein